MKEDTVVDYLQDADLHNANILKNKCLTFIASNYNQVAQTENWERMCLKGGGKLMVEVTRAIASKFQASKKRPLEN